MKVLKRHKVTEHLVDEKFRTYAQRHFKTIYPSNKSIKKVIKKGLFKINGETAKTGTAVQTGDIIELFEKIPEIKSDTALVLKLVFEDDYCAIIDKPPGIPVHSKGKQNISNLVASQILRSNLPDALPVPQPVHRLDALTGGLMIIAKTRNFQVMIGRQFEDKKISKRYAAIVLGEPSINGEFNLSIDGKEAVSEYKVTGYIHHLKWGQLSLVQLFPKTGRTHQLRIHCAMAGFPIFGERKYAQHIQNIKGKGLFLFADKICFKHPITREELRFEIPLPKKFLKYFHD